MQSSSMAEKGGKELVRSCGPWGGEGGTQWDDGVHSSVRQMIICHGSVINSVQIEYETTKGTHVWSEKHGGNGGNKTDKFTLDHPEEYLVSVSGFYGTVSDRRRVLVRSLVFESNKWRYGPFGTPKGAGQFSISVAGAKIVGFHGRSGNHLDALGVCLKPIVDIKPTQPRWIIAPAGNRGFGVDVSVESEKIDRDNGGFGEHVKVNKEYGSTSTTTTMTRGDEGYPNLTQTMENFHKVRVNDGNNVYTSPPNREYETEKKVYKIRTPQNPKMSTGKSATSIGPWGGSGGMLFDDGIYTGVREIHLARSDECVVYIKVAYDMNGRVVSGNKNGGNVGVIRLDKITLNHPDEYLTRISGWYGSINSRGERLTVIKSLTFYTNKDKYGPFGEEQGMSFSSPQKEGIVVGFHGTQGPFLGSIGVHVLDLASTQQKIPRGPWEDPNSSETVKEPVEYEIRPWMLNGGRPLNQFAYPKEVVTSLGGGGKTIGEKMVRSLIFHSK